MGAAIEFEFKGNLAQLKRDLGEASRLAKATASDVSRTTRDGFSGGIAGAFRRTPERRAERAIGTFGAGLLTGDPALAIAALSEKITGFGLVGGVAVGVVAVAFEKFRKQVEEASKAYEGLRSQLSRPLPLQTALGPEGITSQIESLSKAEDTLIEKRKSLGERLKEFFGGGTSPAGSADVRFGGTAPSRQQTTAERNDAAIKESEKRLADLAAARADKELKIANIKLQAVSSSEKDAELAKITLDYEEKRAALLLSRTGGDSLDLFKSKLALDIEERASRLQIEKKFGPPPDPGELRTALDPIPGGRVAGVGESQQLVNELELNRRPDIRATMGLPWRYNPDTGESTLDYLGFKRTEGTPMATEPGMGGSRWDEIGTGIDGIKKGIDQLIAKVDEVWA